MTVPTGRAKPGRLPVAEPGLPLLEHLVVKIDGLRGELDEMLARKLSPLEGKLERLRELMATRRKDHLVVEEFAATVGRTPYTVRRWIAEGRVKAVRIRDGGPRGKLLIPREELERVIASGKGAAIPDGVID